jgi:hypothetical protein
MFAFERISYHESITIKTMFCVIWQEQHELITEEAVSKRQHWNDQYQYKVQLIYQSCKCSQSFIFLNDCAIQLEI